ncbi:hypothetical protein J7E50_24160 [Pedobacter sp. ISL-68]|uniref:hypothetical protein n=1 Tax=unclassified Pedobacter TaxID=2628915 RepID=UPI001BEB550C|nr:MULTISPECIES: hypothetical protein [unclassified Pedobacter]MBT2562823.1 hypothetical protein [Pedobacter sp. ISL-64]MBT2593336.1 hypothetical protein [Pedobacter sp. ISL-68]
MKIISLVFLCALYFIIGNVQAQTYGCLVTDGGNRRLYTMPEAPSTTYTANCGGVSQSNLSGYTGSPVTIDANCSWTPGIFDVQPHTCYIPVGGYCGKLGTYVLACPIDDCTYLLVLFAGFFGFYILIVKRNKIA